MPPEELPPKSALRLPPTSVIYGSTLCEECIAQAKHRQGKRVGLA